MDFLRNCSDINERKDFEVENGQSATEVLESLSDAEYDTLKKQVKNLSSASRRSS